MLSSAAHIEARVKRVLEITHVDSTLLEHLETLSAVFEDLPRGSAAAGGGGSLRSEIDKRALQVAQEFLNQLAPIEAHVRELADAVDAVGSAAASSLARAEADERVSAAFLLAATDTARQRAHVQTEITRLRELAALYSLRAEDVEALEKGPDGAGDDFFEALDRVEHRCDRVGAERVRQLGDEEVVLLLGERPVHERIHRHRPAKHLGEAALDGGVDDHAARRRGDEAPVVPELDDVGQPEQAVRIDLVQRAQDLILVGEAARRLRQRGDVEVRQLLVAVRQAVDAEHHVLRARETGCCSTRASGCGLQPSPRTRAADGLPSGRRRSRR